MPDTDTDTDTDTDGTPPIGARARARRAMLDQIATIAVDLFDTRGFEATTIDDICTAAGISRTTFFRYFDTKEDVLAREFADIGDGLLTALRQQPQDVTAWEALRRALVPLAARYAEAPDAAVRAVRLVISSPALTTFHQDKLTQWAEQITPELARRLDPPTEHGPDPRPQALTTAAFGSLDAALTAWVLSDTAAPLPELLARALSAFR